MNLTTEEFSKKIKDGIATEHALFTDALNSYSYKSLRISAKLLSKDTLTKLRVYKNDSIKGEFSVLDFDKAIDCYNEIK